MTNPIEVGNFIYEQDEKLNWTFKAKDPEPIKKVSELIKKKPEYQEKPQFDIIYDIDSYMQGQMDTEIKSAIKEIIVALK